MAEMGRAPRLARRGERREVPGDGGDPARAAYYVVLAVQDSVDDVLGVVAEEITVVYPESVDRVYAGAKRVVPRVLERHAKGIVEAAHAALRAVAGYVDHHPGGLVP